MKLQGYEEFTENYGCHGEKFGKEANAEASAKVSGGQRSIVGADIRFINEFAEIDMRATKPTIQDAGERRLGVAAVGRGMTTPKLSDKSQERNLFRGLIA